MLSKHQLPFRLIKGDVIRALKRLPDNAAKCAVTSPPYHGKMRRYGDNKVMSAKEWAEWMADVVEQCVRVCEGEVVVVANGCVRKNHYIPSCERLIVNCDDRGIRCERPCIWHKQNALSSRKNWFTNDWEFCMVFGTKADWNWEELGTPVKYQSGGAYRQRDAKGKRKQGKEYPKLKVARPRDVLPATVGGGHLGSKLAHENEAPYPEKLVLPFIQVLSSPGDIVLDPFGGSGTTLSAAMQLGRKGIAIDNRDSQIELMKRRLKETRKRILDAN